MAEPFNETILGSGIGLDEGRRGVITGGSLETIQGINNMAQTIINRLDSNDLVRQFRNKPLTVNRLTDYADVLRVALEEDARVLNGFVEEVKITRIDNGKFANRFRISITLGITREDQEGNDVVETVTRTFIE